MSVKEGDIAPDFSGTELISNTQWSLYAQAGAHVLLAFVGISTGSPSDAEGKALSAVWDELGGQTDVPFTMAIVGGSPKGPGSPPPQETAADLNAAIQALPISCPVVHAPQTWFTYTFSDVKTPALYCLHWESAIGKYRVSTSPPIKTGIDSTNVDNLKGEILAFLDTCGVHKKQPDPYRVPNLGALLTMPVLMQLIGGITSDGGGTGITFGGRPIPVPPWDPLRPLGSRGHDAAIGLVVAALAAQIRDPKQAEQVRGAGIAAAKAAVDGLAGHGHM